MAWMTGTAWKTLTRDDEVYGRATAVRQRSAGEFVLGYCSETSELYRDNRIRKLTNKTSYSQFVITVDVAIYWQFVIAIPSIRFYELHFLVYSLMYFVLMPLCRRTCCSKSATN